MKEASILEIQTQKKSLQAEYKRLMEDAYNLRETDSDLSDISEFRALKLLDEINKLKFLNREPLQSLS